MQYLQNHHICFHVHYECRYYRKDKKVAAWAPLSLWPTPMLRSSELSLKTTIHMQGDYYHYDDHTFSR